MAGISFSVGDIFAVAGFVCDVKKAVKESTGSLPEYEGLVAALDSTEKSLAHLALLEVDDANKPTLQSILERYEKSFLEFDKRIKPYDKSLGNVKRPSKWWQQFSKKIKWQKCTKKDVEWLQRDLDMHAQAMQSFVIKIMHESFQRESHKNQANLESFKLDALFHFASQARHFFKVVSLLVCIWTCIEQIVIIVNRIHTAVVQLQRQISNQVPRAITVATAKLQDANGLFHPIYLDIIVSWKCLKVVIKDIFKNQRGWLRVKQGQYLLCDAFSTQEFNVALPFAQCFRHGRVVDMSMIFDRDEISTQACPRCGARRSLVSGVAFTCECGFYCGLISEQGPDPVWPKDNVPGGKRFRTGTISELSESEEGSLHTDTDLPKRQLKKKKRKKTLRADKPGDFARISIPSELHTQIYDVSKHPRKPLKQSEYPVPVTPKVYLDADDQRFVDVQDPETGVGLYFQTAPAERITDPVLYQSGVRSTRMLIGTGRGGEDEPFFEGFRVREQARHFFTVGKVFLVLWVEPADESTSRTIVTSIQGGPIDSRHGWPIFSEVRRFVVIHAGDNYCSAVPITTYGKRGVGKFGVNKSEHAVIYTGQIPPEPLLQELAKGGEAGMLPQPIRVDADQPSNKLDPVSRINFRKVHTIQHNIKVKSFGRVNVRSQAALLRQFQSVWSQSIEPF